MIEFSQHHLSWLFPLSLQLYMILTQWTFLHNRNSTCYLLPFLQQYFMILSLHVFHFFGWVYILLTTVSGIAFLISFWWTQSVYRNETDFCMLILYAVILLSSFIHYSILWRILYSFRSCPCKQKWFDIFLCDLENLYCIFFPNLSG